jgi:hypothetical protein
METTNPKPGIGSPGAGKERTDARSLGDVLCVEPKGGTLSLHYGYTASIFSELYSILEILTFKEKSFVTCSAPKLMGREGCVSFCSTQVFIQLRSANAY